MTTSPKVLTTKSVWTDKREQVIYPRVDRASVAEAGKMLGCPGQSPELSVSSFVPALPLRNNSWAIYTYVLCHLKQPSKVGRETSQKTLGTGLFPLVSFPASRGLTFPPSTRRLISSFFSLFHVLFACFL